ncbi:MAG: hypothetical protein AMK73_07550 [Planctomycetes bacterium SM23_32]|nr:MAG: hypothetical protein AMK73_07550 [Planctomycetes bacterium SM23_32]
MLRSRSIARGPMYSRASGARQGWLLHAATSPTACREPPTNCVRNSRLAGFSARRSSASTTTPSVPSLPTNRSTASMSGFSQ